MKKVLRMLCMGAMAALSTVSLAQTDVTHKLRNADMEQGVRGWGIDGLSNIFGKTTKSQASKAGYHGFNNMVLENWRGGSEGLADNSISQTVRDLPAGTYVFGAYVAATLQGSEESNKDIITGVTMFANESTTPVATDNPDIASYIKWGHTSKFNVAATVAEGGSLQVGLDIKETNANYVTWDNATLYYFGNKTEAEALEEMAKIDMAATIAIADTCLRNKMNVDSLKLLNEAKAAAAAIASAEEFWQLDEDLYWGIYQAVSSINDYRGLANALKTAKKIAGMEWSVMVAPYVEELNNLIAEAEAVYEEATADRPALNATKNELNEASAYVELDDAYTKIDTYTDIIDNMEPGEDVGEYSQEMITRIEDILEEVGEVLAASDNGLAATIAKHRCDSLYALIEDVLANPIAFDEFPIVLSRDENTDLGGYNFIKGTVRDSADVNVYESRLYRFQYPLTKVRFTVKETGSNGLNGSYVFFTLSSFEMFDEDGIEIPLEEADIISNACHNTLNSSSPDGQGIGALIDDDDATYFHTTWGATVNEHHYIEVTLPEGEYSAFSFRMRARGSSQNHQFPATVEVNHLSEAVSYLQSAIGTAKAMSPYQGTAPGFYNMDVAAFNQALADAESLVGANATDAEMYAAIIKLEEEQAKLDEQGIVMPEPGKKYQIVSAGPFFEKQGRHKAITTYSDSTKSNWLWWETAGADSLNQYFTFEAIENGEGRNYYKMKHEATGLYVGTLFDKYGEEVGNAAGLNAEPDTVELQSLGYGQFGIVHNGMLHCGDHNSGSESSNAGAYGGTYGVSSSLVKWTTAAYNASAWYIREVKELPCATKSISDLNFKSEAISLYEGINTLTLTADKECAFTDLTVYGILGNVIPTIVSAKGTVATVIMDTTSVETFTFAFTNTEGVTTVTVNGEISKLSELQSAYDAAVAVNPIEGDGVLEFKDLSAYKAALDGAEALLTSGGSDAEIVAAIKALEDAVAELTPNMPEADKTYYIVSALEAFETNHGVPMMLYATATGEPRWMYENTSNQNRLWMFEPVEVDDVTMYNIKNVATDSYFGDTPSALVSKGSAMPYAITSLGGKAVALDKNGDGTNSGRIHANGHSSGAGKGSNIVFWGSGIGTASAWFIYESNHYLTDIDFTQIDVTDEYVAPAVKGTFDLYGRRIDVPAVTGIYIVDGKKVLIKREQK